MMNASMFNMDGFVGSRTLTLTLYNVKIVVLLKVLHSDVRKLENQNKDLSKNMNMLYKVNQELAGIERDVLTSVIGKKGESN